MKNHVALGFQDDDAQRARLHADLVDRVNESAGVTVEIVTPSTADSEFAIRHPGLLKKVSEFQVVRQDTTGVLCRSEPTKWTAAVSFFKYSGVSDRILVRLT